MKEEVNKTIDDIVGIINSMSFSNEEKANLLLLLFERVMDEDMAEYVVKDFRSNSKSNTVISEKTIGVPLDILYSVIYEEN